MISLRSVLLVLIAMMTLAPAHANDQRVVRIGTEGTYPPFNAVDEHGRFQGFEIEIARALCDEMNVQCKFVQEKWDDMIPALMANRFDAIVASMSITEERKQRVAFTAPYYRTPAVFVARKAANLRNTSPAAMKGRLIGGQIGTIHARHLENIYQPAGARVKLYRTQQEAQFDLARGRLDALLADKLGIHAWLEKTEQGKCCAFAGEEVVDPEYIGEGVGIAVRKKNNALRERFDDAIDAILANGTYKKINDRYFPFSVY